ncbi:D-serine ammonia-lyase [Fundicoccus culcitae]|uniref:Probable D-serine dehydratase n=1 Tax=Fundicoccus culcitae TaxID=2969821 RepID=A0ABY5P5P5_9LACT|nr:D-serine ammonia-lyase [Fundicoccus culcitae]UUX34076.1 D-serine ammonia-lyase [Fundicoccus culcitae]
MVEKLLSDYTINQWIEEKPILKSISQLENVFWLNPVKPDFESAMNRIHLSAKDVREAEQRLERFAPFIKVAFPETEESNGLIESSLDDISRIKKELELIYDTKIPGKLLLKRDDTLPIAGTIKARGAIYEVLKHAEHLALTEGLLDSIHEDYTLFASEAFKAFFNQYKLVVGTTGNLGISVGVMGAKLGFKATVHMSHDAKNWKKELLASRGVEVIEHPTNFTMAVERGRNQSNEDPRSYFVDDEHSLDLLLGYSVAARRLSKQLDTQNIIVDEEHPLFVYLPCGIGGSPGGITFGLKQLYGDHVHCFFAEPTHMPSMLLGLITQAYDGVSVIDFEINDKTIMDGLAVPRTSGFVARLLENFFSGGFTIQEEEANYWLAHMMDIEDIALEPAALAGLPGPTYLMTTRQGQEYIKQNQLETFMENATHIVWATGGSMVPESDRQVVYKAGKAIEPEVFIRKK